MPSLIKNLVRGAIFWFIGIWICWFLYPYGIKPFGDAVFTSVGAIVFFALFFDLINWISLSES